MILGDIDLQKALLAAISVLASVCALLFWKLYENMRERCKNAEQDRESMWRRLMEELEDRHRRG